MPRESGCRRFTRPSRVEFGHCSRGNPDSLLARSTLRHHAIDATLSCSTPPKNSRMCETSECGDMSPERAPQIVRIAISSATQPRSNPAPPKGVTTPHRASPVNASA